MIDLKVLVKSFNCEDCSCYAENPRESFFCEFAKVFSMRESFAKVGYNYESLSLYTLQLVKGYHLLPPAWGPAGEWYRTFTFPFIGNPKISSHRR